MTLFLIVLRAYGSRLRVFSTAYIITFLCINHYLIILLLQWYSHTKIMPCSIIIIILQCWIIAQQYNTSIILNSPILHCLYMFISIIIHPHCYYIIYTIHICYRYHARKALHSFQSYHEFEQIAARLLPKQLLNKVRLTLENLRIKVLTIHCSFSVAVLHIITSLSIHVYMYNIFLKQDNRKK